MKHAEFTERNYFSFEELISFAYGNLVEDPPEGFEGRLPKPPFLMVDRILSIMKNKNQGAIVAEQDVRLDAWYFQCHMPGDPVHPGCLCVDAIWQLLGFYCSWRGALGGGRALGCGEVSFNGQIRPHNKLVRYEISVKRYAYLKGSGSSIAIGDGNVLVDGELIMTIRDARSGLFHGITYPDYPRKSRNAVGGIMRRGDD
jgi:3-hydroxyacyl-[acyl-carrier protein] dehydratase/trans-2-decenoyl-[acyl-carrier protein] isomerase